VASISLTSQDLLMNREYWTSAPDQILAVQYALQHGVGDFRIAMDSPLKHSVHTDGEYLVLSGRAPSYVSDNYRGDHPEAVLYEEGRGLRFEARLKLDTDGT